jgi:hypothetical protein
MNPFRKREVLVAAYEWKQERVAELQMRIEIEAALLHSLRTELAELRQFEGADLAARFAYEAPVKVARTMHGKRTWFEELKALWVCHKHPELEEKAA